MKQIGSLWKKWGEYIRENPLPNMLAAVILALCYAKQAYSLNFYVDADSIINNPGWSYNWLDIGRFGLVLLKLLLGLSWYNPYLEAGLFLLTLWAVVMSLGFWFRLIDDRVRGTLVCLIPLIAVIHPIYAEQFMFRFQAFEIAAGMLLLVIAEIFMVLFIREKNIPAFALAVLCTVISFGVYQSMVNLALTLCMGGFLGLIYEAGEDGGTIKRSIAGYAGHFVLSFAIYEILVLLFFTDSDYLSGQIGWSGDKKEVLHSVLSYGYNLLKGTKVFHPVSYLICVILLIIVVWVVAIRRRQKGIWYLLGGAGLAASPVYLCLVTGSQTVTRAQIMVSFTCAVILLFVLQCFCGIEKERLRPWGLALCGVTAVVCIYLNVGPLMRMFYTEDVVRRADEMIAVRIIDELETLPGVSEGKAVIFIGSREGLRNPSAFEEDDDIYLCHSVFEFDYVFEPKSYFSTCRILGYFQTFGFSYTLPEADMMSDAYACSLEMACWPLDGSIQEFDDFVIVKLNNN